MEQALIDEIVAKVIAKLQTRMIAAVPKKRVLMLFSGASTGYVVGMEMINMLTQANHELTVFMTASALHVVGEENVRKAGAKEIIGPQQWVDTPGLVRQSDLVLVPTLSMNTAARLALGLMDSLFSTLVLGALLADKPVIAICDGADPYGKGGLIFSDDFEGAPALRDQLTANLGTLIGYGVNLVGADQFATAVVRQLRTGVRPAAPAPAVQRFEGNGRSSVVSVEDLYAWQPGATLRLSSSSRLTPLARDYAEQQNLKLVFED